MSLDLFIHCLNNPTLFFPLAVGETVFLPGLTNTSSFRVLWREKQITECCYCNNQILTVYRFSFKLNCSITHIEGLKVEKADKFLRLLYSVPGADNLPIEKWCNIIVTPFSKLQARRHEQSQTFIFQRTHPKLALFPCPRG